MLYYKWIGTAAGLLGLTVLLGAFGAHSLEKYIDDQRMAIYNKAIFYQAIHSIAIFMIALLVPTDILSDGFSHRLCVIFFFGIMMFSGSLYVLAITGSRWFGAITPIGGIAFLIGWLLLVVEIFKNV